MNYSFFNQSVEQREYLPDSIFTMCVENTNICDNCSNVVWSPVVNGYVHDSQNGKVYCPFGKGDSMNKPIFGDQAFLVELNPKKFQTTTWGRVPQLDPRPLARIGNHFRTT